MTRKLTIVALFLFSAQVGLAQTAWDPDAYQSTVERSNFLYETAQELPEDAVDEREELLIESAQLVGEAAEMLRDGILSGQLDAYREAAQIDLLNLYQNMVVTLADLGYCAAAETKYETAIADLNTMPAFDSEEYQTTRTELEAAQADIEACQARETEVVATTDEPETTDETEESEETTTGQPEVAYGDDTESSGDGEEVQLQTELVEEETDVLPIVLVGSGAALIIAGVVYEFVHLSDLDEFEQIQNDCNTSSTCEYDRGLELQSDIDGAKPIIGVLLGAGIVAGIVGTVLLLTGDGDNEPETYSLAPMVGSDRIGGSVFVRF